MSGLLNTKSSECQNFLSKNDVIVYMGHGIIHRDSIWFFVEVSFRESCGAPQARSPRKNRVNLFRRKSLRPYPALSYAIVTITLQSVAPTVHQGRTESSTKILPPVFYNWFNSDACHTRKKNARNASGVRIEKKSTVAKMCARQQKKAWKASGVRTKKQTVVKCAHGNHDVSQLQRIKRRGWKWSDTGFQYYLVAI